MIVRNASDRDVRRWFRAHGVTPPPDAAARRAAIAHAACMTAAASFARKRTQ
jgi:hypothetical protein